MINLITGTKGNGRPAGTGAKAALVKGRSAVHERDNRAINVADPRGEPVQPSVSATLVSLSLGNQLDHPTRMLR